MADNMLSLISQVAQLEFELECVKARMSFVKEYEKCAIWEYDIATKTLELQRKLDGRYAEDNKTVTYSWAYKHALKGIPYIAEADIGHTKPHMTLINGCYSKIKVNSGKGSIEQILR